MGKGNRLVGIVSRNDLMQAAPPKATTLSVFEANYLLAHLEVREIMNEPITVTKDTPLEEGTRLMVEKGIGCLPVMRGEDLGASSPRPTSLRPLPRFWVSGSRCCVSRCGRRMCRGS